MPLIARRWRVPALVASGAAVALVVALGVVVQHGASTSFDTWVARRLFAHIGSTGARVLADCSNPAVSVAVLLTVCFGAVLVRRWDVLALAIIGPTIAVLVSEQILKPVVGRVLGRYVYEGSSVGAYPSAYPSGHETAVVAAAMVVLIAAGQLRAPAAWRVAVTCVLALWAVVAALGLVRNFYHYATDTMGGAGVAIAVVIGTALLIDESFSTRRV